MTDNYVFVADNDGNVRCFDKLTGTTHWSHDALSSVIGTPLAVGDALYIADEEGDVEVLSATAQYEQIATMSHDSGFESSPIYANDTLFIVSRTRLFAIARMP